jgi:hypothetical protein
VLAYFPHLTGRNLEAYDPIVEPERLQVRRVLPEGGIAAAEIRVAVDRQANAAHLPILRPDRH